MEGSSGLQNVSKEGSSLQKGCVNLFCSQVRRNTLSLLELNKGTLVYRQAEGQGPPGKPLSMIIITKASGRNSFQHGVRVGLLSATVSALHPELLSGGAEGQHCSSIGFNPCRGGWQVLICS